MSKPKILTGFSRYSDPLLVIKGDEIITKMTGNANFATPVPSIADVTAKYKEFETSVIAAASGTKTDTAIKNQKREVFEEYLYNLGLYEQANGKNDESILLSSGFDLQKSKAPIGILPKPENIKVLPGNTTGSVKVSINAIVGADSYIFNFTEMPLTDKSAWGVQPSSKASAIINGLVSGKQYAFKVAGVGSNPETVFSDVVSSFVL